MKQLIVTVLGLFAAAGFATASAAAEATDHPPVVVELFTSQGCSSCPPAEAFLTELTKHDNVIALEFHVDYWDYIGWKDKFAKPEFTTRQRNYVASLKGRYPYTPQMVIQGRTHVVGSHRDDVESVIRRYHAEAVKGPSIAMKQKGETLVISIGAAPAAAEYDVLLAMFDKPHVTEVRRGENRGRSLTNTNVVRSLLRLGSWSGKPVKFAVPLAGKDGDGGCAVLVQKPEQGPILAAAQMPYDHRQ